MTVSVTLLALGLSAGAVAAQTTEPVLSGKTAVVADIAIWSENGKQMMARGDDAKKAPANAQHMTMKIFAMGSSSLREVHIPKGIHFAPPGTGTTDTLIYVQSGRVKVTRDGTEHEAVAGDTIHEAAGKPIAFDFLEPSVFIEASVPAAAK
jgi:hypothetical protein